MSGQNGAKTILLETERVTLRPFSSEFLNDRYVGWLNDPIVMKFSEQRHRHHDVQSCREFCGRFDQLTSHLWAIQTQQGDFVGTATAYRDIHNGVADMGILIGAVDLQGKGIGTAAWSAMRDWLFQTGMRKITAGTMAVNTPMLNVFAKTGMEIEGRRRSQFCWEGQFIDMVLAAVFAGKTLGN